MTLICDFCRKSKLAKEIIVIQTPGRRLKRCDYCREHIIEGDPKLSRKERSKQYRKKRHQEFRRCPEYMIAQSERLAAEKLAHQISPEQARRLINHFPVLGPRSELILKMRLGIDCDPQTLQAIGEKFGVSRERIRELQFDAIRKLKKAARIDLERWVKTRNWNRNSLIDRP